MSNELNSKYIYVVDDTSFMRAGLIKILVELGCDKKNIFQFENGQAALVALNTNPNQCDLILSDWNMPLMTGLEFLKGVRSADSKIRSLPFVLITTESEKDKVIEALKFKLSGYILKPISHERIKEVIESVFQIEGEDV